MSSGYEEDVWGLRFMKPPNPDPNCCGWEGDCEGCGFYNHHKESCGYKKNKE